MIHATYNKPKPAIAFDPSIKEHRLAYAYFLAHGRWQPDIRFMIEDPYTMVPVMVQTKLVKYFLEQAGEVIVKEDSRIPVLTDVVDPAKHAAWFKSTLTPGQPIDTKPLLAMEAIKRS